MKPRVLIVDDEEGIRYTLRRFLEQEGYDVVTADSYQEAVRQVNLERFDLVFTDLILDSRSGIEVLREVRKKDLCCPVVIITGFPDIATAFDAVRLGAYDYIPKPMRKETLVRVAQMALRHRALIEEKEIYRTSLEAVFASVKDALISVDTAFRLLEYNPAAGMICHIVDEALGKPYAPDPAECSGACVPALRQSLEHQQTVEVVRLRCHHLARPNQVVTLSTSPLFNPQSRLTGVVMSIRDETRMASLEENLTRQVPYHRLIGQSVKMKEVYALVKELAQVPTTVLILGESGTGKELVAEAIHFMGERQKGPLIKVNCAALPDTLLESELFGHVKGAFTGAVKDKVGRFQLAHGGTLFLDEIGDISPGMQLRLLRVLQEREFERVGDNTSIRVDVRIIAATNQDLLQKVRLGLFREDLYYRLKVVEVRIPALRERREDIPLLVNHFLTHFNRKFKKNVLSVTPPLMRDLMSHLWPGNIRELENLLEYAFVVCHDQTIDQSHMPQDFLPQPNDFVPVATEDRERSEIRRALEKSGGNKAKAARLLGISRQTLYRKLQQFGMEEVSLESTEP